MQDVMEHLNIAKSTIYHYFKSKEELLEAVIEQIVSAEVEEKRALLATIEGSAMERMLALIKRVSLVTQNDALPANLHKPGNMGMHMRLLSLSIFQEAQLYGEIIRQGVKEGIFHTDHPLECAEFILSGLQFLTDTRINESSGEDRKRRAIAMPGIIESILGAPAGTFRFLKELSPKENV